MPLPLDITWFIADEGATYFETRDETNRLAYSIPLIDCHEEILSRPGPSQVEVQAGFGPSSYYLKRSAWVQERLLHLYLTATQGGISNEGYFYGAFNEVGVWYEVDTVRLDGTPVYTTRGGPHQYHRIGLLYSPRPIPRTTHEAPLIRTERFGLPARMLELMEDRATFDRINNPVPEVPQEPVERPSRYRRNLVI